MWIEARGSGTDLGEMAAALTRLDRVGNCQLVELQISKDGRGLFAAVADYAQGLAQTLLDGGIAPPDLTRVFLVDADPRGVRARQEKAEFLIECSLPPRLTMDAYLARRRQSATIYPFVPEASLLRTYVTDDLRKCFLFYTARDAESAKRACRLVGYRVSRLHTLAPKRSFLQTGAKAGYVKHPV
jgi:hypothetical protein